MSENQEVQSKSSSITGLKRLMIVMILIIGIGAWANNFNNREEFKDLVASDEIPELMAPSKDPTMNGFDITALTIPTEEVLSGGPHRDGIPALFKPKFIPPESVDYLNADDIIISFTHKKETKAYPLKILVWHEIANDTVGGKAVAITYCPLCGTSMVFDRKYKEKAYSFGVSGLLYNSDVLIYDKETESLWSQIKMEAVSGPMVGQKLSWLPSTEMTWAA